MLLTQRPLVRACVQFIAGISRMQRPSRPASVISMWWWQCHGSEILFMNYHWCRCC